MVLDFEGRVVLIAGATGALGQAVTRAFADAGATLALTARSAERLSRLVAQVGLPPTRVLGVPADVTDEPQVGELMAQVEAQLGRVDVLINAVGGWSGGKATGELSVAEWERMLSLNLRPAFLLSRAVLPSMLSNGWGRIIFVGAKTAVMPRPRQAAYIVSKAGVIALTQAIAAEVKGSGVTANVILPSVIRTPANLRSMPKSDPSRWVPPEEIAAMMLFLCTDAAAAINGALVPMYGAL